MRTEEEKLELQSLLLIKGKGYITEEETKYMWSIYEKYFGKWIGSYTCSECIRERLRILINKLS